MGRVSEWAVRRPVYALLTWLGIMAAVVVLGLTVGGNYNDNFQLPDTESTTAQNLLEDLSGSAGTGAGLDGQVVWKADSGKATEGTAGAKTEALLTKISTMPGVACVQTPFGDPLGPECPAPPADQGTTRATAKTTSRATSRRRRRAPRRTSASPA